MRILIGCEYSGRVREAFRALGHDAWSCDLLDSEDDSPYHIKGDVLQAANGGVGSRDIPPAVHTPCRFWRPSFRGKARGWPATGGGGVLPGNRPAQDPAHGDREPGVHHVIDLAQARSSGAAFSVRRSVHENDLSMVKRTGKIKAYQHS